MACSNGLNQRLKKDRISQLPDPLLSNMLSHLPPKEAVRTSVLSTRWRGLWLWVPRLDLSGWDFQTFNAFKSFGDKFFDSNRISCIDKVNITVVEREDFVDDDATYLKSWIDAAVKRKIQHLHVCCPPETMHDMPPKLFSSETLVSLKLYEVNLGGDVDFVSLPCLKTLHLKYIWYHKETIFERLVSSCPVLEELKISGCVYFHAKVFRVLSTSLKKFSIDIGIGIGGQDYSSVFMIDAPRLCFLRINDKFSESFIINDMDSNAKVDISLPFGLDVFDEPSILSRRK